MNDYKPSYANIAPDIIEWGKNLVFDLANDPCIDNFRMALISDEESCIQYDWEQSSGCCGYIDIEELGPDGKYYRIGCNYGH